MEANFYKQASTQVNDINKFEDGEKDQSISYCSFGRSPRPELVELKVGYFYEIDHEQVPRQSPLQIEGVRVVLVNEITDFRVIIRSPSTHSLRNYFNDLGGRDYPLLDKQFVMGPKLALQILVRKVPSAEFSREKHLPSFWLVPAKAGAISTSISNAGSDDEDSQEGLSPSEVTGISTSVSNACEMDEGSTKGVCLSYLQSSGLLRWGVQKRMRCVGRHQERTPEVQSLSKQGEAAALLLSLNSEELKRESNKRRGGMSFLYVVLIATFAILLGYVVN